MFTPINTYRKKWNNPIKNDTKKNVVILRRLRYLSCFFSEKYIFYPNLPNNCPKMFYFAHIVFAFHSCEKFSLIHDCHTSVLRWGIFLITFFCFVCFLLFFYIYKLKFSRNYKLSFSCNLNNLFCSSILFLYKTKLQILFNFFVSIFVFEKNQLHILK